MGKISTVDLMDVKVKVPRKSGKTPCGAEMVSFLACLDLNGGDEAKCTSVREALATCVQAARQGGEQGRRLHKMPINFHLRTFLRNMKK